MATPYHGFKFQAHSPKFIRPGAALFKEALGDELRLEAWPHVDAGRIRPIVQAVFPLVEAAGARRLMEGAEHVGKFLPRRGEPAAGDSAFLNALQLPLEPFGHGHMTESIARNDRAFEGRYALHFGPDHVGQKGIVGDDAKLPVDDYRFTLGHLPSPS